MSPRFSVFDAHVDSLQLALDLGQDLAGLTSGHLDFERGRAGGLETVVLVQWVNSTYVERPGAVRERAEALLGAFHHLLESRPDRAAWAGNGDLVRRAHAAGRVACIGGIEGGHSIEESLERLEWFFERGVRVLTLVWNNHLSWVRSCQSGAGAGVPAGLNAFGRSVVRRMNELGMVVDVSHAGVQSFYDVLDTSTRPIIASHSACFALHDHPRNLNDEQLRALADANGVVGIAFCTAFLDRAARAAEQQARRTEAYQALRSDNDTRQMVAQGDLLQASVPPLKLARLVDHIEHAVNVCGIDAVGLGSDFDGIECRPEGLESAAGYPVLATALEARGFDQVGIDKIFHGNMQRVFAEVTRAPARAASAALVPLRGTSALER